MTVPSCVALLAAVLASMGAPKPLPATHPTMVRAHAAMAMARLAVEAELPGTPAALQDVWVARIWGWSGPESGWQVNALGDCKDSAHRTADTCASYGIMQTMNPERWGFARAAVLADGVTGYRVGLRIMRYAIAHCGSLAGGLGMYASGKCGGAPVKVHLRCKMLREAC